ncbi:hypothetical protein F8388_018188 [Cannabis sativa]|uniref:non-specific serine/threonine protein kinase n=1 Tax=Cannabis sativa TaxID=3483 RepID=A0A7J6GAV5_CANSA|nr:hypothetical protein F8388_018188 [Cannabis sativa]
MVIVKPIEKKFYNIDEDFSDTFGPLPDSIYDLQNLTLLEDDDSTHEYSNNNYDHDQQSVGIEDFEILKNKYRLYFVLDFINGGDLDYQLHREGLFREDLARVYTAEIISAISYLHENGIMHRDLKPHNILLDSEGHVMVTDFGMAKQFDENTGRSNTFCGTDEYMAPEIVQGRDHDKAADWWSVGILLFEMLTGQPPFTGGNKYKIHQKIVKEKIKLPAFLSSEAHSLLKGLLKKDPRMRLGSGPNGGNDIKRHKWFKTINWKKLECREIKPSFLPKVDGDCCVANFEKRYTKMALVESPASTPKFSSGQDNPFKEF